MILLQSPLSLLGECGRGRLNDVQGAGVKRSERD